MESMSAHPVRIRVFGGLEIEIDGRPLQFGRRAPRKCLDLLGALIACGDCQVNVGSVCDLLWPDVDGDDAYAAFTITLHRLRRLLGHPDAVLLSSGRLKVNTDRCWVDAFELERSLRKGSVAANDMRVFELCARPFLAGDDSPWALGAQARIEHLVRRSLHLRVSSR